MKIVAVSRILNEDDVIEAFIRHHATLVDHHILLDNGSIDHTVAIVTKLREEGIPLSLLRSDSVVFNEEYFNTLLYGLASEQQAADWVVYLDADEFLDLRQAGVDLRTLLSPVPAHVDAVRFDMIDYQNTQEDDADELLLPRRIRYRAAALSNVGKLCIRGRLGGALVVAPGNHDAYLNGRPVARAEEWDARLAHYTRRHAWAEINKVVVGRLKVLASGSEAMRRNRSNHYTPVFERLLHKPAELLLDEAFLTGHDAPLDRLVLDPIHYEGGALRHTHKTDYRMKAAQSVLSYMERLARHHGTLLEQLGPAILAAENRQISQIF